MVHLQFRAWCLAAVLGVASSSRAFAVTDDVTQFAAYLAHNGYGVLPLVVSDHNRQLLKGHVNGKSVYLVVDTGCSITKVRRSFAEKLGAPITDTKLHSIGAGGVVEGSVGSVPLTSFTLGNYEINRERVLLVFSERAQLIGPTDGLFGYDLLHANSVILPVGAKFLWYKPGAGGPAEIETSLRQMGFQPASLTYGKGGLHLQGTMNSHPFTAIVDSGCALSIFDPVFITKKCGLRTQPTALPMKGVDGRIVQQFYFTTPGMSVGSLAIPSVGLLSSPEPFLHFYNVDALIGYDLLAAHQAIIDLGHNVLWMK